MINYVGRRIYYDIQTGDVLLDTGERWGWVTPTTKKQDIQVYAALTERNSRSFDCIELDYGQYSNDFADCNGYHVNLETKQLEFSYPDPEEPGESGEAGPDKPQIYRPPLSEEVDQLKQDNAALFLHNAELDAKSQQLTKEHAALLQQLAKKGVL
ncbi:cell division protein ZapB [Paenibacillus apiarius]|uniref:Cell division protein ZapB n=1 Tax=Paenibacillus apiarius TaxID=46240 RepID=A0ABT4DUY4_9BACL|nr:cell division protein ZapB [Paenibacillus apiarius]MCY9516378.1 cell division protein ZapB [Paenibacillus apiarius]MCY9521162.1 cell division protein ZapB [Paenibacillus apiarius]MCY9552009.1 cell division protein ZapB [Paenibacillus apiarius]MCY9560954.1 cell division protein ZapB [Paenibacillus apiarius]MCY9684583.1 cell division protein ZapB [Paenibacillus apiarius]